MNYFKLIISYDGTNFYGYQRQKAKRTIQQEIEKAITKITTEEINLISAGRTDKGVHSTYQVANFKTKIDITTTKLQQALNTYLPKDIHIKEVINTNESFHSRYDAKEKTYKYLLNENEYNVHERNYVYQYNKKLNINEMIKAKQYLIGTHEFDSFVTQNEKQTTKRTIKEINIKRENNQLIFTFTGDGFLKYQVRNMIGILIKVGEEKLTPQQVKEILEIKDRSKAPKMVPPEGLYLINIKY